jgi:hypothetical protein
MFSTLCEQAVSVQVIEHRVVLLRQILGERP